MANTVPAPINTTDKPFNTSTALGLNVSALDFPRCPFAFLCVADPFVGGGVGGGVVGGGEGVGGGGSESVVCLLTFKK